MMNRNESGNVLWIILIAVALMGLLTFTLGRSGSSVDQSGDVEQASIKISQMLRFVQSLQAAAQDMKMRGVSESDISFANTVTATSYANTSCDAAADRSWPGCLMFDARGSGLTYIAPPAGVNDGSDWIFTSANNVGTSADPIGTSGANTGNDLIAVLANMNQSVCIQINRKLGVSTGSTIPTDASGVITTAFTGAYTGANVIDGDPTPFELDGHAAGCITNTAPTPVTYFYSTILPR
jgi:hypothetical protein